MALLVRSHFFGMSQLCKSSVIGHARIQLRWRKIPRRKPKWLPMAPSKVFRIPVHPYVPPDEAELIDELLKEYTRRMDSMSKLFKEELDQKSQKDGNTIENQQWEEEKLRLLLEENKQENERIKVIREATLEKLFQERELELLELDEKRKEQEIEIKMTVDKIVRKEKEKYAEYITYETLENAVEEAIDSPINVNFSIDINGDIKWEGKPPVKFEEELKRRIAESMEN